MANYSQTAASVLATGSVNKSVGTAGATIVAGQPLYADSSDSGKLKLGAAGSSAASNIVGVAVNGAASGQPVAYVTADDTFTHGLGGVAAGDIVILSATAGAWCPASDLASSMYCVVAIICISATQGILKITRATAPKA